MEAALYLFDRSKQHGELYTWDKKSSNKAYIPFGKDDFYRNRKVIKMRDKLNPKKVESAMDIVVEAYFPIQSHDGVFFGVFHIIQKKNDASYKQLRRTVLSEEALCACVCVCVCVCMYVCVCLCVRVRVCVGA